jgi:RimJ/RimL family protein N-acetyltransferase
MNNSWIPHPTILKGTTVELLPLEKAHLEELYIAASDKKLWEFIPIDGSDKNKFTFYYEKAISDRDIGIQYPFAIYHKPTKKLIGSTRLFEIFPDDRKLEIGWTWIEKEYWGTAINFECKLLLLAFCFESLKAARVQLKTKDTNIRSRTAIEKLGAKFEGVFRKDRLQDNGVFRNTAYFSIIDDEWKEAKAGIISQLNERNGNQTTY